MPSATPPATAHRAKLFLIVQPRQLEAIAAADWTTHLEQHGVASVRIDPGNVDLNVTRELASAIKDAADQLRIPVLVRDHPDWVAPLELAGVQLGLNGPSIAETRAALGAECVIGFGPVSRRHSGMRAAEAGADYVALGPLSATSDSAGQEIASVDLVQWWSELIEIPCLIEGGITAELATETAGFADFIGVDCSGCDNAQSLHNLLRDFRAALSANSEPPRNST